LVLHREPARPSAKPFVRSYRGFAQCPARDTASIPVPHQCHGGLARPPARSLDLAAGRCRFFGALAPDQAALCTRDSLGRAAKRSAAATQRARHLATTILGAP